jgi:hypothetical protein
MGITGTTYAARSVDPRGDRSFLSYYWIITYITKEHNCVTSSSMGILNGAQIHIEIHVEVRLPNDMGLPMRLHVEYSLSYNVELHILHRHIYCQEGGSHVDSSDLEFYLVLPSSAQAQTTSLKIYISLYKTLYIFITISIPISLYTDIHL